MYSFRFSYINQSIHQESINQSITYVSIHPTIYIHLSTHIYECTHLLVGLLAAADWVEPRLERDVVLEPRPGQPPSRVPPSLPRFKRKPSGPRATLEFLYHSGTLSFWRERCTRSWCSDITLSPAPPFCSSFSGGCKHKVHIQTNSQLVLRFHSRKRGHFGQCMGNVPHPSSWGIYVVTNSQR